MVNGDALLGYTVGVTAARRRTELGSALERRGASVIYGPAIRVVPLETDAETLAATERCIAAPPDIVVVTTAIGFRGWVEAADGWGLADPLFETLRAAEIIARGPKVRGAIRAAGLVERWSPASESTAEVLEHLTTRDLSGLRVAVQLHGEPLPDLRSRLADAGAEVVEVPIYRWVLPEDVAPLHRLLRATAAREIDALAFTSAPASASFLRAADDDRLGDPVRSALRSDVLACCVGVVTAAPLVRAGVPVLMPERPRLGALVREIAEQLPARAERTLSVAGHVLTLRGPHVLLDGSPVSVGVTGRGLLRVLADRPGKVVSRTELSGGAEGDDAIETAVARLRSALGHPGIVETVVKRGYRLAVDAPAGG